MIHLEVILCLLRLSELGKPLARLRLLIGKITSGGRQELPVEFDRPAALMQCIIRSCLQKQ